MPLSTHPRLLFRGAGAHCVFVAALLSLPALASAEEGLGALRGAAMGGNVIATGSGTSAIFHNPAGVASLSVYSVEFGYDVGLRDRTSRMGFAVADSKTNPAASAGFAYTFSLAQEGDEPYEERRRDHDARLALASQIVPDRLSLGVGGRYLSYRIGEDDRVKGFSLDIGGMARLSDSLFFGLVARDLIRVPGATGARKVASALGVFWGPLRLEATWRVDIDPPEFEGEAIHNFGLGGELGIQSVRLRAGWMINASDSTNVLSVGAGYESDVVGVNLTFRQHFDEREDRQLGASFSINF